MISPRIREIAECVRPLVDERSAAELNEFWQELPGAAPLGRLGAFARHVAMVRNVPLPMAERLGHFVFCGSNAVSREAVHAGDETTTRAELLALMRGEAPGAIVARQYGVDRVVVDVGLTGDVEQGTHVYRVCEGAQDYMLGMALSEDELNSALEVGAGLAQRAAQSYDMVAISQLGDGGVVSASTLAGALLGASATDITYCGDIAHDLSAVGERRNTVHLSRARHEMDTISPSASLRCFAGAELAAMTGFLLHAATLRLPVFACGYCGAAASVALRALSPDALDAVLFPACGDDAAWNYLIRTLGVTPLLDFAMDDGGLLDGVTALHLVAQTLRTARVLASNAVSKPVVDTVEQS